MSAKTKFNTRTLAVCAMFSAMAYAMAALSHFLLPPLLTAAPFLKYDPKDVVLAIAALILGPAPALAATVVASVLEMLTISHTHWIGCVMNIVSSAAFILPGALLYSRRRTLRSAVIGLLCGVVFMTGLMLLMNVLLTPMYMKVSREAVVSMLVPVFLPFNGIKSGLNAAVTLLIYKPLIRALRAAKLLPASDAGPKKSVTGVTIGIAGALLVVCMIVLAILNREAVAALWQRISLGISDFFKKI